MELFRSVLYPTDNINITKLPFVHTLIIWAFYSILKKDKE